MPGSLASSSINRPTDCVICAIAACDPCYACFARLPQVSFAGHPRRARRVRAFVTISVSNSSDGFANQRMPLQLLLPLPAIDRASQPLPLLAHPRPCDCSRQHCEVDPDVASRDPRERLFQLLRFSGRSQNCSA